MWRTMGYTGSVGLEIVVYILLGYYGGRWLVGYFDTGPWLGWLSLVVCLGAAIKALVRVTRVYKRSLQKEDAPPPEKPPTA
jgi:F0F1-type ATP synthase assembly protein I